MKNRSKINNRLVFAKRNVFKNYQTRTKKKLVSKKIIILIIVIFIGLVIIYAGYVFSRNYNLNFFLTNKTSEKINQPIVIKKEVNEDLIKNLLELNGIDFLEVKYATMSSTLIITLQKDSFAYLIKSENIEEQLDLLAKIIARLKIENPGKKIKYIDLRFDKPIIKF